MKEPIIPSLLRVNSRLKGASWAWCNEEVNFTEARMKRKSHLDLRSLKLLLLFLFEVLYPRIFSRRLVSVFCSWTQKEAVLVLRCLSCVSLLNSRESVEPRLEVKDRLSSKVRREIKGVSEIELLLSLFFMPHTRVTDNWLDGRRDVFRIFSLTMWTKKSSKSLTKPLWTVIHSVTCLQSVLMMDWHWHCESFLQQWWLWGGFYFKRERGLNRDWEVWGSFLLNCL
jgi:hypothetical protein